MVRTHAATRTRAARDVGSESNRSLERYRLRTVAAAAHTRPPAPAPGARTTAILPPPPARTVALKPTALRSRRPTRRAAATCRQTATLAMARRS